MIVVIEKLKTKQLCYSSKTSVLVIEFSNNVTFGRNACVDVILTSVTITKQDFLFKMCYESQKI